MIPKVFRSALKINPGSRVVVRLENNRVVVEKKKTPDATAEFERIAKSGRSVDKISPHLFDESLSIDFDLS